MMDSEFNTGRTRRASIANLLERKQSRRSLLRQTFGIGLSISAAGGLLAACGGDDDDDDDTEDTDDVADETDTEPTSTEESSEEEEGDDPADDEEEESPSDSEEEGGSGGQAIIASIGEPDTLLSGGARSATAGHIFSIIGGGLTTLAPPEMAITEELAESWEVSDDGMTFTFDLREGATWQDGEPVVADDVKASYETWAHPDWPGELEPAIAVIEGAQDFKDDSASEISGIEVIDDGQVQFTLSEPAALFLATAAIETLFPRHLIEDISPSDLQNDDFARVPTYGGPFRVADWNSGESITYEAVTDHYGGSPALDTIVSRFIPDQATALAELQSGGIHMDTVSPDHFDSFVDDPNYETQELSGGTGWFLQFDLTNPLFEDPRVRKAMSHAIDRQAVIDSLFLGRAEANFAVPSPLSWIYNPDVAMFPFDLDRANELMDEAGWEMGDDGVRVRDGERFEFTMNVTATTNEWAVAVQPFLEEIGILYEINQLEFGTWIDNLQVGRYEGSFGGWGNFILDPRSDLSTNFESPRPADATGYDNEEVNELFQEARVTIDADEEAELYNRIQEIVAEDAVFVYLWRPSDLLVVLTDLEVPDVSVISELYARSPEWQLRT